MGMGTNTTSLPDTATDTRRTRSARPRSPATGTDTDTTSLPDMATDTRRTRSARPRSRPEAATTTSRATPRGTAAATRRRARSTASGTCSTTTSTYPSPTCPGSFPTWITSSRPRRRTAARGRTRPAPAWRRARGPSGSSRGTTSWTSRCPSSRGGARAGGGGTGIRKGVHGACVERACDWVGDERGRTGGEKCRTGGEK
mmetsp:Transcript_1206/g.2603  ORF Transcript_1206/g.2603 Transcript_1206/m.2603 type:complete len:200 (-) Transcript_1206:77-676(-)